MLQGNKNSRRSARTVSVSSPSLCDRLSAILRGDESDPFSYLGMHRDADGALVVRGFYPTASAVTVLDRESGDAVAELECVHDAGFFAGVVAIRREPSRIVCW